MLWIILFGLLLAFLLWVLFTPIYFKIEWNESRQGVQLYWWGVFRLSLTPETGAWAILLELPFFRRSWPLKGLWSSKKKGDKTKKKTAKGKTWKPKHPWQLIRRLGRSFHLIRFHVQLDTDDYVWNAYLFPLFQVTNPANKASWQINFKGRNELILIVENRLYRLLYAFIRSVV